MNIFWGALDSPSQRFPFHIQTDRERKRKMNGEEEEEKVFFLFPFVTLPPRPRTFTCEKRRGREFLPSLPLI